MSRGKFERKVARNIFLIILLICLCPSVGGAPFFMRRLVS